MPEETTLEDAIRRNASGPKSAEVDGQKVEQHSLTGTLSVKVPSLPESCRSDSPPKVRNSTIPMSA